MSQIPDTLTQEVVKTLNALIATSDRFRDWDSLEIQSLLAAIRKLQKVDARSAFVRFGGVAAICGNVEALLDYYGKALQHPDELETKHEFWVSLGNAGLYKEASQLGTWLLDPRRGFFPKIWDRAVSMGQVLETWNRLSDATKTYPGLNDLDFSLLQLAASVMTQRNLTDEEIISVFALVGEVQRAHRIMFAGPRPSYLKVMRPPEDPPYLYFTVPLAANVAEIHAMNRELTKLIVEKLPTGAFPSGMVVGFTKAHAELRAAA